jgi:hypothetical protein
MGDFGFPIGTEPPYDFCWEVGCGVCLLQLFGVIPAHN